MGRFVSIGALKGNNHVAITGRGKALLVYRGSPDITAQALEFHTLIGLARHSGVY
jgi:hypothetical protein